MTKIEWTDAERDAVAYRLIHHYRVNPPAGDCSCGHVVPLGHSFPAHQADEALNALTDLVAARQAQAVQDFIEKRDRPVIKVETAGEAKFLVDTAGAERDALRATVARVEALADEWEERCEHYRGTGNFQAQRSATDELRAALGES